MNGQCSGKNNTMHNRQKPPAAHLIWLWIAINSNRDTHSTVC